MCIYRPAGRGRAPACKRTNMPKEKNMALPQIPPVSMPSTFLRRLAIIASALLALYILWPFYSVPTGSRGVVTQFGAIVGIEGEGLAILPPWRKLSNFSIRAEQADIEDADGST